MLCWLAGGSGLVGGELLTLLLNDPTVTKVVSVGRRMLPLEHPKLVQANVDFKDTTTFTGLEPPDVAFSCLGTTIKKAGSREAFRAVDYDAVLAFAKLAHARGAKTFVHVSSLGADPQSAQFYSAVKGDIENALKHIGFASLYALRPSILDGERKESRPLERAGLLVARALGPFLGKYKPTASIAVARTMLEKAKEHSPGHHILEASAIL